MPKTPKYGPEYSREREFKVILEDLQSQFRTFGEGLQDVRERVERIEVDVRELKSDVREIKSFLKPLTATVSDHEHRLTTLESRR